MIKLVLTMPGGAVVLPATAQLLRWVGYTYPFHDAQSCALNFGSYIQRGFCTEPQLRTALFRKSILLRVTPTVTYQSDRNLGINSDIFRHSIWPHAGVLYGMCSGVLSGISYWYSIWIYLAYLLTSIYPVYPDSSSCKVVTKALWCFLLDDAYLTHNWTPQELPTGNLPTFTPQKLCLQQLTPWESIEGFHNWFATCPRRGRPHRSVKTACAFVMPAFGDPRSVYRCCTYRGVPPR